MKKLITFFFPKIYSPKGRMDIRDAILGLSRAGILSAITTSIESINAGSLVFNPHTIASSFMVGVLTYVLYSVKSGVKDTI
jgi:hypothetical protein